MKFQRGGSSGRTNRLEAAILAFCWRLSGLFTWSDASESPGPDRGGGRGGAVPTAQAALRLGDAARGLAPGASSPAAPSPAPPPRPMAAAARREPAQVSARLRPAPPAAQPELQAPGPGRRGARGACGCGRGPGGGCGGTPGRRCVRREQCEEGCRLDRELGGL